MKRDPDCIFCKIIAGEIPDHKVYEDDLVAAFLDIGPLSRGHTLVIPKSHYERLEDLPDEDAAALGRALPKIARAIMEVTGAKSYNVLQNNGKEAGQEVFHVHYHIIPRYHDEPAGDGLRFTWLAKKLGDDAMQLARQINEKLQA